MSADVVIEHDYIIDVVPHGTAGVAGTGGKIHDFGDRLLVPGFVDLHSDAIEKEIEPRPGASFPVPHALVDLDKKLAMSGITTMFHAVAFNDESLVGQRGTAVAAQTINEIVQCNRQTLQVDNLVHARYEITSFNSIPVLKRLLREKSIRLLSLMDHSPGQGQFKSLESWKKYHIPVYNMAEQDVDSFIKDKIEKRTTSVQYLEELTSCARGLGVTLASHDDDTTGKVDLMYELGIGISEFPLNAETAAYAQKRQILTGMGAPNVVRGQSQNGNISARSLIEQGLCDFLCSDYHPCSMLQAVYTMHREIGIELAQAYAYVSTTPAQIGGLVDRGKIEQGLLADILVVEDSNLPKIVMTLKDGTSIYNSTNCLCTHEYA
jgi:alpha-D-ribose 1-methylphosphonate 5-triphosphate diphosphatase